MQSQCTRNRFSQSANELETLFNQVFGSSATAPGKFVPPVNVVETESNFQMTLELPGIKLEDISVEFVDDTLQISGEKKVASDESAKACHCSERHGGSFKRSFRFPTDVDNEKIEARLENGLLMITMPKAAKVLPRKVEIKNGN